ncbi:hypothetical protein PanWU01x14_165970 [Parasponia andersonii]|uniref:Uncharacterized protein n=1 Tax=Parasponia andersonii TaxID=3476 RepID=A0A2P5CBY0_PARAD|nr:hypothetical protein PanWU01x14_165970 [Parasponia andersonii]
MYIVLQSLLIEYDFQVTRRFKKCCPPQLLLDDPFILMKLVVPSDTYKKYLENCGVVVRSVHLILYNCTITTTLYLEYVGTFEDFQDHSFGNDFKLIQAICQKYDCKIDSVSSLVDGKSLWSSAEESIILVADPNAVHNFLLSQKLTTLSGNFVEVLQISDRLEFNGACNEG